MICESIWNWFFLVGNERFAKREWKTNSDTTLEIILFEMVMCKKLIKMFVLFTFKMPGDSVFKNCICLIVLCLC